MSLQKKLLSFPLHIKKLLKQVVCNHLVSTKIFLSLADMILLCIKVECCQTFLHPQLPSFELLCCQPQSFCHIHHTPFTTFSTSRMHCDKSFSAIDVSCRTIEILNRTFLLIKFRCHHHDYMDVLI